MTIPYFAAFGNLILSRLILLCTGATFHANKIDNAPCLDEIAIVVELGLTDNFMFAFLFPYLRLGCGVQADEKITSLDPRALLDMAKNASEQLCPVHYVAVSTDLYLH